MDSGSDKLQKLSAPYGSGYERSRLESGAGLIERDRTRELLVRFLPKPPAVIRDIGGGPGGYACWLAKLGYEVHLRDVMPNHVEEAREASRVQPEAPLASAEVGDACNLEWEAASTDAMLLLGPLYHLVDRTHRLRALQEAHRVLRPGGVLMAAGISRFASVLDGVRCGYLKDPEFVAIVTRDIKEGQHRNPSNKPEYFTDAFFHLPDELRNEVAEAGFDGPQVLAVEGPAWLASDVEAWWSDPSHREVLMDMIRTLELEPHIMSVSAHLMAVARKD